VYANNQGEHLSYARVKRNLFSCEFFLNESPKHGHQEFQFFVRLAPLEFKPEFDLIKVFFVSLVNQSRIAKG